MAGFIAYIDESGDEGFKFLGPGVGSSEWFVLSAAVTRAESDLAIVPAMAAIRATLGKPPLRPLHFVDMKHEHRVAYVAGIAQMLIRTVSILVHKPSIASIASFNERYRLYFYTARFLIERVSWLCREAHARTPSGDGTAELVFSNRSNMPYDELREYIDRLLFNPERYNLTICPQTIQANQIRTRTHDQVAGLQVADGVASSFFAGIQTNRYKFSEPRYALMLKPVVYAHERTKRLNYGVKIWPKEAEKIVADGANTKWIADLCA